MRILRFGFALLFTISCVLGEDGQLGPKDGFGLPPANLERVGVGVLAPDFTLKSKDDDLVTLSSFRGKNNVLLVFYRGYW